MTWRHNAVRLTSAAVLAVGATLLFAGPSSAATRSPEPRAASDHSNSRGHADPTAKPSPSEGTDAGGSDASTTSTPDTPAEDTEQRPASKSDAGPGGDNGTVKVHRSETPADDRRNEPKVCSFYLVGFGFDSGQQVSWRIKSWPPTGDRSVVSDGELTLDEVGHGRTADMSLPDGHYKLFWNFVGEKGSAKHKVFWVSCGEAANPPNPSPTASATPTPTTSPPAAAEPQAQPPAKNRGANLPFTGFPLWAAAAIALALLLAGTTIVMVARKRA